MDDHLRAAALRAQYYVEQIQHRNVFPTDDALDNLSTFDETFPDDATSADEIVRLLDEYGSPATVATTGGRYFGFVTGGILPAALASNWMMAAWDQNGGLQTLSPVAAKLELVALHWLVDLLGLPAETGVGFVTGATMANFTALAAARNHLLARAGWDVEAQGLFNAPEIKVVVGDEVHVSVLQALSMLGFGRERVTRVPVDTQGRMRADELPELDDMTLVCIQAGNVNSGAFDPATEICAAAHEAGAWVHVDGAFGLWALATPKYAPLAAGVVDADSWATDGHKWLNVSYDNGLVFCKHPQALVNAMNIRAPYLVQDEQRQPFHYTPEQSRRARGIEIWAALKSLGRTGLAAMIERGCQLATQFATGLEAAGFEILNDVVLNQIVVSLGDDERTDKVINAVQADRTMWAGRTVWQGRVGMRISVSSWATTSADIEQSLAAIIRVAQETS